MSQATLSAQLRDAGKVASHHEPRNCQAGHNNGYIVIEQYGEKNIIRTQMDAVDIASLAGQM